MKKVMALVLSLATAASLLAGCGGTTQNPAGTTGGAATQPPEQTYLDTYKSTFSTSITSMNPYTTAGTTDYVFIANLVDGLVESDKYGIAAPCIAERWETNDDCSVWTFHLRKGVYWVDHTGAKTEYEVTADDFIASLRYVSDPAHNASSFSTIRGVIKGLEDYYYRLVDFDEGTDIGMTREAALETFDAEVGIKAIDPYTVEYTLSGAYPYFLAYAQLDLLLPVEQALLDEVGEDFGTAKDKLLYNGGYYISTWDRDKQVVMSKNENYWDVDALTINKLNFEFVTDSISGVEMFKRGNLTETKMSSEEVASVRGSEWENYVYLSDKTATTYWYSFNFASKNPEMAAAVQNENFRKAIFTAIDAVTVSAIWEPKDPAFFCRYTLLPEAAMFDSEGKDYTDYGRLKEYKETDPFSAEKAKEYMTAAIAELCEADGTIKGCTPGRVDMLPITEWNSDGKLPIDILYTGGSKENEMKKGAIVKEMLETYLGKENVNVILGYSSNSFSAEVYELRNFDMLDDSYGFRYADPSANLNRCTTDYDITESGYEIPEFDAMIEKADALYDIDARFAAYAEAECWLLDHAYIKPFMTGGGSYNMTRIVPYTTPGGYFGMGPYKMKGAKIQETPVTTAQHAELKTAYEAEKAALKGN